MAGLKDLRVRIKSIKSTQKITSAMKMVAVAKLRKAQEKVQKARPYTLQMKAMLTRCLYQLERGEVESLLLTGRPDVPTELIMVATSDRGLCGGFNTNLVREVKLLIRQCEKSKVPVKIFCLGRKGYEALKREYSSLILGVETDFMKEQDLFATARKIAEQLKDWLEQGHIGKIHAVYSVFKSALTQEVCTQTLVPFSPEGKETDSLMEFEPNQQAVIETLLPLQLASSLYEMLLETSASEHGARMTAMDNATRNARDVIQRLELTYNRTRQAVITKELIEIISGAEAL